MNQGARNETEKGYTRALEDYIETEGTTDDRQPWSHHAAPPGRLDRHAGRHEQTYESRVRAGRLVRKG